MLKQNQCPFKATKDLLFNAEPIYEANETAQTRESETSPQPAEELCHASFFSGVTQLFNDQSQTEERKLPLTN